MRIAFRALVTPSFGNASRTPAKPLEAVRQDRVWAEPGTGDYAPGRREGRTPAARLGVHARLPAIAHRAHVHAPPLLAASRMLGAKARVAIRRYALVLAVFFDQRAMRGARWEPSTKVFFFPVLGGRVSNILKSERD